MKECTVDRVANDYSDRNSTKGMIFRVYKAWFKDNNRGYHFTHKGEVKKLLEKMGKSTVVSKHGGNEYYADFTLTDEIKKEYEYVYGGFDKHGEMPVGEIGIDLGFKPNDYHF